MERCNWTVKRIVARLRCSIAEAMYWYNATPKDNEIPFSMPANGIYQYEQRMKGIDPKPSLPEVRSNVYQVGEPVWVKPPDCWCTTRFCKGQVDRVISPQTVLVNGTHHHVKDLHRHDDSAVTKEDESDTSSGSEMGVMVTCKLENIAKLLTRPNITLICNYISTYLSFICVTLMNIVKQYFNKISE